MDEVLRLGKKLEKMTKEGTTDQSTAMDILKTLEKQKITLDILQKSRIGMTVNNFRKSSKNDDVVSLAKKLIKGWKKLLPANASSNGSSSPGSLSRSVSTASTASSKNDDDSRDMESQDSSAGGGGDAAGGEGDVAEGEGGGSGTEEPAESGETSESGEPEKKEEYYCAASETDDPVRLKCREMLANALKTPPEVDGHDPTSVAAEIEDCIFDEFRNTDTKYKNRVRSRIQNLKDTRNPELRQNVLIGLIQPSKMAAMTSEEMASKEMKELREKLTKEAIDDHQMSTNSGTVTDLFKCGKCGKRNCTYTQLQTRSSDEPMTTFVFCNVCGNRWKFC